MEDMSNRTEYIVLASSPMEPKHKRHIGEMALQPVEWQVHSNLTSALHRAEQWKGYYHNVMVREVGPLVESTYATVAVKSRNPDQVW